MWAQIIQGKAKDPAGLSKQMDRWVEELRPNAIGFLGSTSGVTDDGEFITIARFSSEEEAMQNSGKPEQDAWWKETSQYFDGEPTFRNAGEVEQMGKGGSDDAGFVQVIQSKVTDIERMRQIGKEMDQATPSDYRPDFIGGTAAWDGEVLTQVAYFTSEAEARVGEKQDPPEEMASKWQEMGSLMQDVRYLDLREPKLVS